MLRVVKLTDSGLYDMKLYHFMLKKGGVVCCPHWEVITQEGELERLTGRSEKCFMCKALFPRTQLPAPPEKYRQCPCFVYSIKYLQRRTKEIINYNERIQ